MGCPIDASRAVLRLLAMGGSNGHGHVLFIHRHQRFDQCPRRR